jgi:general secretion pathway protein D
MLLQTRMRTCLARVAGRRRAIGAVLLLAALASGCAAGRAFGRGNNSARAGDWDAAVEHYRRAIQADPEKTEYKIAYERAMISASVQHLDQARVFEVRGQLDEALREYRRASNYDPPNRQLAAKVLELERTLRDQAEASRPRTNLQQLREAARRAGPPPLVNLNTVLPGLSFPNNFLREILTSIGQLANINVTFDSGFTDRQYAVRMDNVTLEEALNQILLANQLFYKVVNQRTIIVVPDNPGKRAQYEELVVRTFQLAYADTAEISQIINTVARVGGTQLQPVVAPNKTQNSITIRATAAMASIIERIIELNDRPAAEVVVDVQILEVSRGRAKQFGIDLSEYAIQGVFSPERDPRGTTAGNGTTAPGTTFSPQPFNLNTVSRGINTADFYLAVPSAVLRFLESDNETKVVAKPQLRGAEGREVTLNLGERIPIPSTTFTPIAQGGANFNPLTSVNYENIGVNLKMTPRVTLEGDIMLDLEVENSAVGPDRTVAGTTAPSFTTRKVVTRLRLREGESSLLAGLLREDERRSMRGIPGIVNIPILRALFASNDTAAQQTDIVMLLTPRIVRTHELTQQDLESIFIGTQSNLGIGGPPPLISQPDAPADAVAPPAPDAQPPAAAPPAAPVAPPAAAAPPPAGAGVAIAPPGSSPVPGTTLVPSAPSPGAPPVGVTPSGGGQVMLSVPPDVRVGGGPYTLPIAVTNAFRLSSVALTLTYNPAVLRVRTVQEGAFMRTGGGQAPFTPQVDAAAGRIDIVVVRTGDTVGVAGTGTLAGILFDAIAPGPANLSLTGSGSAPGGGPLNLQFSPVPVVTVR